MSTKKTDLPTTETTLNLKEQAVCDAYLRAGGAMNMSQAYATQFKGKGCAFRFFRRKPISAYIAAHQRAASERTGVSVDRSLREAACVAHSNIKDVYKHVKFDENGHVDLSEIPDWVSAAIDSVKVVSRTVTVVVPKDPDDEDSKEYTREEHRPFVEVKMLNKSFALDMMFKVLGAYKKDGSNPHVDDALAALVKAIGEQGMPKPGQIRPPEGHEAGSLH